MNTFSLRASCCASALLLMMSNAVHAAAPAVAAVTADAPALTAPGAHDAASTPAASTAPLMLAANASRDPDSEDDFDEDSDDATDSTTHHRKHDWTEGKNHHSRHDHDHDIFNLGHDSHLAAGQEAESVVSVLGSSTSEGEATDVVSVLGNTRVTGPLRDNAVAILGSTYIDSKIDGDAVAVVGNVELGPHADIGGDVVAILGTVTRDPAAIVYGSVDNVMSGHVGETTWAYPWIHHALFYARPLALTSGLGWAWTLAFGFLALYAVMALMFRTGVERCVQTLQLQPGYTVLAALIAVLLTPVLVILLCVTVIGIAAVPFVIAGIVCLALFGRVVALAWLGNRLIGNRPDPAGHPALAVVAGSLLVLMLYLVPVLGIVVYNLLGILGLGAVVYTLILSARARQAAKADPLDPAESRAAAAASTSPRAATGVAPVGAAGSDGTATSSSTATAEATAATGATATADSSVPPGFATAPGSAVPPPSAPQVTASMPHAGFWIRMAALLIDVLLVGFALKLLHPFGHFYLLILAIYGAMMWKLRGATVGNIVFDLHVVRIDGRDIDWETACIRALGCFLSMAVVGLGFIWIALDDANQAWHDKIAGTVVVRAPRGSLGGRQ